MTLYRDPERISGIDITGTNAAEEAFGSDSDVLHPETRAVHITAPSLHGCHPLSVPLYQSSAFAFDHPDILAEAMSRPDGAFVYSRRGNPLYAPWKMPWLIWKEDRQRWRQHPAWAPSAPSCCLY